MAIRRGCDRLALFGHPQDGGRRDRRRRRERCAMPGGANRTARPASRSRPFATTRAGSNTSSSRAATPGRPGGLPIPRSRRVERRSHQEPARLAADLPEGGVPRVDLVEALPVFVWTARADGSVNYVNDHWRCYTGRPRDEALGSVSISALHPDDAAQRRRDLGARRGGGPPLYLRIPPATRRRRLRMAHGPRHPDPGPGGTRDGVGRGDDRDRGAETGRGRARGPARSSSAWPWRRPTWPPGIMTS